MKYGLSQKQIDEIRVVLSKYEVIEEAIIFGSRAIDTFKEASDIDIVIKGENVTLSVTLDLKAYLEEETYLPFFFDVVAYNTLNSDALIRHIDSEGRVFYRKRMGGGGRLGLGI